MPWYLKAADFVVDAGGGAPGADTAAVKVVPAIYCPPRHFEPSFLEISASYTGTGRKPGASLYTQKCLSPTGARAKSWCLLIHMEASLSYMARANAWCLLVPVEASLSLSLALTHSLYPSSLHPGSMTWRAISAKHILQVTSF